MQATHDADGGKRDTGFEGNIARFTGFSAHYDEVRPSPPPALAPLLCRTATVQRPRLVVDLGSGTGLSTRYWAGKADAVIGVEPSDSMRNQAVQVSLPGVCYRKGFSHDTGLPEGIADLVTCAQSLHWMDPEGTFREAARLLRAGGVFAAFDYDWPPATGVWQVDQAYERCMKTARDLERHHGVTEQLRQWEKEGHLGRMQDSGQFTYVREVLVHHVDDGTGDRLSGLATSQGHVQTLLKLGLNEDEIGLTALREACRTDLGNNIRPWLWSSRVRMGVVPPA